MVLLHVLSIRLDQIALTNYKRDYVGANLAGTLRVTKFSRLSAC